MKGRPEKGRFGPDRRVRKRPEFLRIQSAGRRISTKDFVLIVAPADHPSSLPRLGITASKRVGNSVERNRVKRVVRAAFRHLASLVPSGFDLVVICKGPPARVDLETVVQQWLGVASRLKKATAQLKPREDSDIRVANT